MSRSTLRPTLLSVVLHGVLLALLLRVDGGTTMPGRPTIIRAQLLSFSGAEPASEARESRAATAELPTAPAVDEDPRGTEPESDRASAESAAPTRAGDPAPVDDSAADGSAEHAATDESSTAAAAPEPEPARDEPERPLPGSDSAPVPPPPRTVPMSAQQHRMLSQRFAAWTARPAAAELEPSVAWEHDGRQYAARLMQVPADDPTGTGHVIVEVSTEENGATMSTELRMRRLALSSFAQFIDRWDPEVQIHDDEIDGRFHSNSAINVRYSREAKPVFHGRVTTASRSIRTDSTGRVDRGQTFLGGLETGVHRIPLPKHVPPPADGGIDPDHVHRLTQDARITFRSDGTYVWQYVDSPEPEQRRGIAGPMFYIVGADDTELRLKGVLKGRVLVHTLDRIIIEGDLVYSEYPNVTADTDDSLGLVADKSVEVAEPEVTGPGDLVINASIYAKRQFAVRSYRARGDATLVIYGSLAAGSVTATEPRFATKIQFDPRLENTRPPGFPLTDRYELEAWDGEWRIDAPAGAATAD